jgi:hypothetical protein
VPDAYGLGHHHQFLMLAGAQLEAIAPFRTRTPTSSAVIDEHRQHIVYDVRLDVTAGTERTSAPGCKCHNAGA